MKMKFAPLSLIVISILISSCSPSAPPTPTADIEGTVQAKLAQQETQTAIAGAQATLDAKQAGIAATQTALALPTMTIPPTIAVPTKTPTPHSVETKATCPFYVYQDFGSPLNHFKPAGWMGDYADIKFDDNFKRDTERPSVIQITYSPRSPNKFAGIYWWDPPNSAFGAVDGGFDLSCATKLTFWAKGEKGGEKAEFKVGGIKGTYQDSLQPALSSGVITLSNKWFRYSFPSLAGRDLSHIIGGFVWVTNAEDNPNGATIYLDEIVFE